jgi:anti-sigma factor RsiW
MTHEHGNGKERCIELAGKLSEYLDEELPADLRREVEAHFESCADCEHFLTSLRRVKGAAPLLPPQELSPERLRKISEAVRRRLAGEDLSGS